MVAWQHVTWLVLFFVLPAIAVPGNVFLLAFSLRRGRNIVPGDVLMAALSLLDVFKVSLITMVAYESYYHNNWTLSEIVCQFTMKSLFVLYFMTLVVILFLTRLRHMAILASTPSARISLRLVGLACLLPFLVFVTAASIPNLYAWQVKLYGETRVCELNISIPRWFWICCQFCVLAITLLPSLYLPFVCYRVRHTLQLSLRNLQATANMSHDTLSHRQHENRRVVLSLAFIAFGFTVCWVPVNILHALELFRSDDATEEERLDELLAFHRCLFLWLVGFESCVSTIAFSLFNRMYRVFVRSIFKRRRPRSSTTSTTGFPLGASHESDCGGIDNSACFESDCESETARPRPN